jgi:Eco57I restriction-modification methylase
MDGRRSWDDDRSRLLAAAARLGGDGRDAVRLADLLLARVVAAELGLLDETTLTPTRIASSLAEIALHPLPQLSRNQALQRAALEACRACAANLESDNFFELWSESSQSNDPGRKGRGAFSTPPSLGRVLASTALRDVGASRAQRLRALDPSAGHGALLLALLDGLLERGIPAEGAARCLYGVELDPHARELCCIVLWLRLASRRVSLTDVAARILLGNALTAGWETKDLPARSLVAGDAPHARGFAWQEAFPDAFAAGGFDLVIANPPWESLRACHPAELDAWQQREETRERLSTEADSGRGLPPLYSAQGRGDRNLCKGFAELFPHLLRDGGRLVALLPGAFSSDLGMQPLRQFYLDRMDVERWTGFENRVGYFPIDSRYKFGLLVANRRETGTASLQVRFMASQGEEATDASGHLELTRSLIEKLGGASKMFPEVSDDCEVAILKLACGHGCPFFDPDGSFGPISYHREVDLTLDRKGGRFVHVGHAAGEGFRPTGKGTWSDGREVLTPLIEGRMVTAWDFFEKSWVSGQGRSARWRVNELGLQHCQPQFLSRPTETDACRLAICDVTSSTNTRTMRASWVPSWLCGNTAPVLTAGSPTQALALLAVLNSMTFDWLLRRFAAGLHLNRFYLEAMPLPQLNSIELEELAGFAATRMLSGERCRDLAGRERAALERELGETTPLAGRVEAVVARGYGLGAAHLRQVMDAGVDDRKGLWRFFAANPEAIEIAREGIELLAAA